MTTRRVRRPQPEPSGVLSVRGLVVVLAIGATAAGLGVGQTKLRFDARDYDIEARRLQELTQIRRDEVRKLEAKLGGLRRDDNLREAAIGPLGMVAPEPEMLARLEVDEAIRRDFERAAGQAREHLAERRSAYNTTPEKKEVPEGSPEEAP